MCVKIHATELQCQCVLNVRGHDKIKKCLKTVHKDSGYHWQQITYAWKNITCVRETLKSERFLVITWNIWRKKVFPVYRSPGRQRRHDLSVWKWKYRSYFNIGLYNKDIIVLLASHHYFVSERHFKQILKSLSSRAWWRTSACAANLQTYFQFMSHLHPHCIAEEMSCFLIPRTIKYTRLFK